jgi:serine/threonine protein kinase/uncharacterized protein YecT (DUF1311 family)
MITADGDMPAELSKLEKGYELIGELSRDEMVTVYVARDRLSGNEVAIKVLRAKDARGREALAHYASDARLLTALEHPNIVAVHGVKWLSENVLAVIAERVRGPSLRQVLDVAGTLPVARATEVLKGLARALAWAHSSQIMHRDVRPENVTFEDGTGRVVLSDFGLARRIDAVSNDPSADAYRAPELADGRYPDRRTDVYSLGIVGWELLTGRRPWPDTMDSVPPGQRAPEPPPLAAVRPGLPPALVSAIEGAVQLDRERRIPDVVAFVDRLTGVAPPPRPVLEQDEEADALVVEPSEWVALPMPKLPPRPRVTPREALPEAGSGRGGRVLEPNVEREADRDIESPALGKGRPEGRVGAEVGARSEPRAAPEEQQATERKSDRQPDAAPSGAAPLYGAASAQASADAARRKARKGRAAASPPAPRQADRPEATSVAPPGAESLRAEAQRIEPPRPEKMGTETRAVGLVPEAERPRAGSERRARPEEDRARDQVGGTPPAASVAAGLGGAAAAAAGAAAAPAATSTASGARPTAPASAQSAGGGLEPSMGAAPPERLVPEGPKLERVAPPPLGPANAQTGPAEEHTESGPGGPTQTPVQGPISRPLTGPISGPVGSPIAGQIGGPIGGPFGGPFGVPPIDGPTVRQGGMRGGLGTPRSAWRETHGAEPGRGQPLPPSLDPVFDTPAEFPLPVMPDPRPIPPDANADVGGGTRPRWTRRGVAIAAAAVVLAGAAVALATMERAPDTTAGLMRPETPPDYAGDVALDAKIDSAVPAGPSAARPAGAPSRDSAAAARRPTSSTKGAPPVQTNAPPTRQPATAPGVTSPTTPAGRPSTAAPPTRGARTPARPSAAAPAPRTGATTSAAPRGTTARTSNARRAPTAVAPDTGRPAPTSADRSAAAAPCNSPALADQRACLAAHVARSDARLNEVYNEVIAAMRRRANSAPGDPDPPEVQRLRAVQRRWVARRDAECRRRGRGREGPLWATPRARCLEEFSADRAGQLSATLGRLRRD